MRVLWPLTLILLLAVVCSIPGQPAGQEAPSYNPLNSELDPWSPAYTVEKVAEHLSAYQKDLVVRREMKPEEAKKEASYLRYFDCSDAPRRYLPAVTAGLLFWNNELSPAASVQRPRATDSSNRLFYVDLRWYCWTPEAWETVSNDEPYFREPLVPSDLPALQYMKSVIGNGVLRASWFLYYTADTSQFLKAGELKADNAFYYTLLYSSSVFEREVEEETKLGHYQEIATGRIVYNDTEWSQAAKDPKRYRFVVTKVEKRKVKKRTVGVVPQNAAEFQQFWGIDPSIKDAGQFTVHRGAVIDEGKSGVSYQNRIIAFYQATRGLYMRTFDVFRTAGDQDFFETTPVPEQDLVNFDAGEHIFMDMKGGVYFMLSGGSKQKEPRVEIGDPRLVKDQQSGGKVLLVTAKSCVACHDKGIIAPQNEVTAFADVGGKLKGATPFERDRLKAFYFSNLQRIVKNGQENFADFVKECNGLTMEENATQFQQARSWYASPVTLEQAAREVGAVDVKELQDAAQYTAKGRIGALILNNKPIPRQTWEFGGYSECFLLLIEYRKAAKVPIR